MFGCAQWIPLLVWVGIPYVTSETHLKDLPEDMPVGCPLSTYYFQNHCYGIVATSDSYQGAKRTCNLGGGILAPVSDSDTYKFFFKLRARAFMHHYWTGLTDIKNEGVWRFGADSVLNDTTDYSNWVPGEPNNADGGQHCVVLAMEHQMRWDDVQCERTFPYICQFDDVQCSGNQTRFQNSCFQMFNSFVLWQVANTACTRLGGHLVYPKTAATQSFLRSYITSDRSWLEDIESSIEQIPVDRWVPSVWVGMEFNRREGQWVSTDGQIVEGFTQLKETTEDKTWWLQKYCASLTATGVLPTTCVAHNFVMCRYNVYPFWEVPRNRSSILPGMEQLQAITDSTVLQSTQTERAVATDVPMLWLIIVLSLTCGISVTMAVLLYLPSTYSFLRRKLFGRG